MLNTLKNSSTADEISVGVLVSVGVNVRVLVGDGVTVWVFVRVGVTPGDIGPKGVAVGGTERAGGATDAP
jgi:hypothetical protein